MFKKRFNKKGMMDDLFDFMFTMFMAVIIFVFLFSMVNNIDNKRSQEAINHVEEKKFNDQVSLLLNNPKKLNLNQTTIEEIGKSAKDIFITNYQIEILQDEKVIFKKYYTSELSSEGLAIIKKEINLGNTKFIIKKAYKK